MRLVGAASRAMKIAELDSLLTCPHCGHARRELMPADACQFDAADGAEHAAVAGQRAQNGMARFAFVEEQVPAEAGHMSDVCGTAH